MEKTRSKGQVFDGSDDSLECPADFDWTNDDDDNVPYEDVFRVLAPDEEESIERLRDPDADIEDQPRCLVTTYSGRVVDIYGTGLWQKMRKLGSDDPSLFGRAYGQGDDELGIVRVPAGNDY
jgi:hypothetical protein